MKPPSAPCPWCASTTFAWLRTATFELLSDEKLKWGNVLHPEVGLLICEGCGHTAWFLQGHTRLLAEVKHTTVSVAAASSGRG